MHRLFLLLFFFGHFAAALSQAPEPPQILLGARAHYGFIIPHSEEIADVSDSHPRGLEMNIQWIPRESKQLKSQNILAKRGVVLQYMNFDNPEVLGYSINAVPYIEPLFWPHKRLSASIQAGLGLAYLSNVYNAESNPTNLFFSTQLSFPVMVNVYANFRATDQWYLSAGFNYNHISNGGMKEPNKGMNYPTWNAGASYAIRPIKLIKRTKSDDWKNDSRWYGYIQASGTSKKVQPAPPDYPSPTPAWLWGGQAMVAWRFARISGVAMGTEWVYDGWTRTVLDRENNSTSATRGAIMAGYELLADRVRFSIHLGTYVYNPAGAPDPVYQRYGLFYRFTKHLEFGTTLKAHRHVAEVFDLRISYHTWH
ncbi:MAG: acyloxyacyl hydrolase [Saprospiraceae bacterium]|nr:acyloxyacyl hydrolase [Saprospiraceae bacterium]